MTNRKKDKTGNPTKTLAPPSNEHRQALTLDVDYYQSFLDAEDIPEQQKRELIETLWNIVVTFVDLGFGIEAAQRAMFTGQEEAGTFKTDIGEDKGKLPRSFDMAKRNNSEMETRQQGDKV